MIQFEGSSLRKTIQTYKCEVLYESEMSWEIASSFKKLTSQTSKNLETQRNSTIN